MTSDQSNLTKRPHDRRTWTVQTYSPDGANVQRHLIMSFGHSLVHNPKGVSIGSAVFAVISNRDRQTDHATPSVAIGRIYVHSTAMRPIIKH